MKKENKNWKQQFKEEFGIHFKGSKGELNFAIAFIEDLLKEEKMKKETKKLKELKQRRQEGLKENKESFIGILTDEEAEKMRKEVNSFRERFDDDFDKKNKELFEEQKCDHHWIFYPDHNSSSAQGGCWRCDNCGKIKFLENTSTSYSSYIVWRK